MREVRLPPEVEVGQGYGRVDWGVRAIWEGYAGWFHQRSTTELYPVPALEALLAAHQHLLAERGGENFWETGWLRHQIARTRRALEARRA